MTHDEERLLDEQLSPHRLPKHGETAVTHGKNGIPALPAQPDRICAGCGCPIPAGVAWRCARGSTTENPTGETPAKPQPDPIPDSGDAAELVEAVRHAIASEHDRACNSPKGPTVQAWQTSLARAAIVAVATFTARYRGAILADIAAGLGAGGVSP